MKKKWFIASYKVNEVKRVKINLSNQKFDYYLPKITINNINSIPKEELLFPGYIFVNTGIENYSSLKYTIGIKNILKFGNNIPYISQIDIEVMQMAEKISKINPIPSHIQIGQEAMIVKGSLKGTIVKICSLPSKDRVDVLLNLLGSIRRVSVQNKDLAY
jgi:transcription antitermination factor NusG